LAQKHLEFLDSRWRDDLEDHSIALTNDHELVAFVEPEVMRTSSGMTTCPLDDSFVVA
jgi:hypothetical protein